MGLHFKKWPIDLADPIIYHELHGKYEDYQTVTTKLGIVHHRAVLRNPKDFMKLLPWTNKIIENAKAVFAGPHGGVSKNISKAAFQK